VSRKLVHEVRGLGPARPTPGACTHAFARVPGTARPCSGAAAPPGRVAPWKASWRTVRGQGGHGVPKPAGPRAQRPRGGAEAWTLSVNLWDRTLAGCWKRPICWDPSSGRVPRALARRCDVRGKYASHRVPIPMGAHPADGYPAPRLAFGPFEQPERKQVFQHPARRSAGQPIIAGCGALFHLCGNCWV